jgi:hypothetical protein
MFFCVNFQGVAGLSNVDVVRDLKTKLFAVAILRDEFVSHGYFRPFFRNAAAGSWASHLLKVRVFQLIYSL